MKFKVYAFFISILLLFAAGTDLVLAQSSNEDVILEELVDTLNFETEEVYDPYIDFTFKDYTDYDFALQEFNTKVLRWKSNFLQAVNVYDEYKSHNNQAIAQIAQLALQSSELGVSACDKYISAMKSETEAELERLLDQGDDKIARAAEYHDQAVELYNDYSGASSAYRIRDWLIFFSIVSFILSGILFFKSRSKTLLRAEVIKSRVYKDLFTSSVWMTVGLIVTTVGYTSALKRGGTYYILYGPVLVGGWKLIKGLYVYLTDGRAILNKLSDDEKYAAIKSSYKKQATDIRSNSTKKCDKCGSEQSVNNVVCNNCGGNLL